MNGDQPCDFSSSPVSSNILRLSHPMTGVCGPPALVHSVLLPSSAKIRWCVGKQVLIKVNVPVAGSYIDRWRLASSSGNTFADGWSDPFLQKSGLAGGRTRAVIQILPFSSIIGLCVLVWLSQMGASPQYGDGAIGLSFEDGVFGSRTGCLTSVAVLCTGSRIGRKSVLSSVVPKSLPLAFSVGVRRSVEISSCSYAVGRLQSHRVRTILRSTPWGRAGWANGSSPLAIRSVQSPNNWNASRLSSRLIRLTIWVMACPDWMRRSHASAEELKWPSSLGIVRVPIVPSAWQNMQPVLFTRFTHWA